MGFQRTAKYLQGFVGSARHGQRITKIVGNGRITLENPRRAAMRIDCFLEAANPAQQVTQIVDFVMNLDKLVRNYKVELSEAKQSSQEVFIPLTPKTGTQITRVELRLSKQQKIVSEVKLFVSNGNHLTIQFKNPSRKAVDPKRYILPAHVTINDLLP